MKRRLEINDDGSRIEDLQLLSLVQKGILHQAC